MPAVRKRRAEAEASPSPPTARQRREAYSDISDAASDAEQDSDDDGDISGSTQDEMVKKLVRLALASEYTRQPLRRTDISVKVLAPNNARAFKTIFASAQERLQRIFGMSMTELPTKDRVTITQKRAAQRANGNSQGSQSSSKAYVLTSTLPSSFRSPNVLHPAKAPTVGAESGYIGLYSFIVSAIYLSEGSRISEGKLERHLKRCNADNYVLNGEKTENVLKRMEKQGYIVKVKDREPGGEEMVDWVVGPRGKVEIGERGVAALVKNVYGKRDVELEELEDKLDKSLGAGAFRRKTKKQEGATEGDGEGEDQNDRANGVHEVDEEQEEEGRQPGANNGRNRRVNGGDRITDTAQRRRSSRRSSGFVDDEAGDEEEDELNGEGDEEDEEENEDEDEDEAEED